MEESYRRSFIILVRIRVIGVYYPHRGFAFRLRSAAVLWTAEICNVHCCAVDLFPRSWMTVFSTCGFYLLH